MLWQEMLLQVVAEYPKLTGIPESVPPGTGVEFLLMWFATELIVPGAVVVELWQLEQSTPAAARCFA